MTEELCGANTETYGPEYQAHLLEQYKLYVQMADQVSQRRVAANNYLLTVNASLVALYGLASSFGDGSGKWKLWVYAVPAAGFLVCLIWLTVIRSYRDINAAKFKVIHEVEKCLPATLFAYEWQIAGEGKGEKYWPTSHVEQIVPCVFMGIYALLVVFALS